MIYLINGNNNLCIYYVKLLWIRENKVKGYTCLQFVMAVIIHSLVPESSGWRPYALTHHGLDVSYYT